jgi:hypothetical protein
LKLAFLTYQPENEYIDKNFMNEEGIFLPARLKIYHPWLVKTAQFQ